ncbi:cell envelope biogenesis protein TolA [Sphingomonas sp. MAH-20]|uniref:Cell envelope biogenesis protein TolA n=1 Tax=Sphingomonas horti TaxID=2682842 RepID=A0A6I4IZP0_9SPHN|nr:MULTISPECIES: cell envelope biogenesis protein TolA [Sphingomonas]MBA2920817.1 cell envelope biogenesis protein TolA [Sphingomonas sp. CGMCC 1.13658]MVO77752.1 cell envelope biogenesis protein TolA [Sphingomonas horti]
MDRAEKFGLGAATAGHVVLFGLLSVGFLATPNPLRIERPPVEVTFADDVGLEATAARSAEQPPATSVAPELGRPEEAAPAYAQNQPEPAPAPAEPAPAPVPTPTPKPNKPPVRERAEASKAAPAKPAQSKARGARLGPDFLKGITEAASVSRAAEASAANVGPRVQASLASELKRQLKPHWRPPSGADVEKLRVTIVANLALDGTIVGQPRVIGPTGVTPSNRAQANLFVERALAAVRLAAPYHFPKEYYAVWKRIEPQLYEGL